MRVDQFDFSLPPALIATQPVNPRDSARMLVVGAALEDACVRDLPQHLTSKDCIVFNDTRVFPARLLGTRGDAKVELLLLKHKSVIPPNGGIRIPRQARDDIWTCLAKPAKKLKVGDLIHFADDFTATVLEKLASGEVIVALSGGMAEIERYGHIPLPPYMQRGDTLADKTSYQTIYAAHTGSVAAPTAGLHFTPELLAAIDDTGAKRVHITLHVGAGTFQPVKVEDTREHKMHSEWAQVSPEAAAAINACKASGGRVFAVGTTSLRTLESATKDGVVQPFSGETDIFITPGYRFACVDVLMTNFHLPKSTLFMLVGAFCGLEKMQAAYAHAIASNYRFYSYGDACLLFPPQ